MTMLTLRTLVSCALLVALTSLAACSGSGSSSAATASQGATASSGGGDQATPTASANQGGSGGDLGALADALKPPNSTQLTRTDATGGLFISWSSTDSADSLKGFYEEAIPKTGMKVLSTTNSAGTFSWIFAEAEGSSHGGSVTVGPASDGGSGSNVILTATSG